MLVKASGRSDKCLLSTVKAEFKKFDENAEVFGLEPQRSTYAEKDNTIQRISCMKVQNSDVICFKILSFSAGKVSMKSFRHFTCACFFGGEKIYLEV